MVLMSAAKIIEVSNLTKRFDVQLKRPGLWGTIEALLHPKHRSVIAVDSVNFNVKVGETLAFIGPNGAGKSTTIKMLTGILHPSEGKVLVAGCVPWDERIELAHQIGCVFGQRSQLWYHLPAQDSFEVLGRIFELSPQKVAKRIGELSELLELGSFLDAPVRKLSLGQRMRCEVAAALLHEPRILFLDEPTIGLDVVAKRKIRDLIARLNSEENTTIFLTSHDATDIEQLCRRVIVVNDGRLVLDTPVKELKRRYLRTKVVGVRFAEVPERLVLGPGLTVLKNKGAGYKFQVDTFVMSIGRALAQIAKAGRLVDITVMDPPLEQVIATIYGGEEVESCVNT